MTKFKPAVALLAVFALAGCANSPSSGIVTTDITAFENTVVAGIQSSCKVSPVASDLAKLIPVYGMDVAAVINAVCGAVNQVQPTAAVAMRVSVVPGMTVPNPVTIHGVVIHFK